MRKPFTPSKFDLVVAWFIGIAAKSLPLWHMRTGWRARIWYKLHSEWWYYYERGMGRV